MYTLREVIQKKRNTDDDDRASYWYWRGWEVALGGENPSPGADMHDNVEFRESYELGLRDGAGKL